MHLYEPSVHDVCVGDVLACRIVVVVPDSSGICNGTCHMPTEAGAILNMGEGDGWNASRRHRG